MKPNLSFIKLLKKKKNFFSSKLDLNMRKKLMKCYTCSIALYGAETLILEKVILKYLGSVDKWCWRRMLKFSWRSCEK
jgi:hypothetical protein